MKDYETRHFAQGARCGHLEGKGRAGSYVLDEEYPLAEEAAINNVHTPGANRDAWARGYRIGYRLAAEGKPLPDILKNMELP